MQLHFTDPESWRSWLAEHHLDAREVWMIFYKKHTGKRSISYDAAVEEALCFGWIDSIIKRLDDDRYLRKFTPRTNALKWSALNLKRIRSLVKSGRMTEAGMAKVGAGVKADIPPAKRQYAVPAFFRRALVKNPAARQYFDRLAPSYRRQFVGWVVSAKKEETRQRRLREAIERLAQNRKLGLK